MVYLPPDDRRHGLNGYNNLGCRCAVCTEAVCTEALRVWHAAYMAAHPEQRKWKRAYNEARRRRMGMAPLAEKRSPRWPLCAMEDCPKKARSQKLCGMHYRRLLRHGDPLVVITPEQRRKRSTA